MFRTILLTVNPLGQWEKIEEAGRGIAGVLFLFFLPNLVLAGLLEGLGLVRFGDQLNSFVLSNGRVTSITVAEAVRFECFQAVVTLGGFLLIASLLHLIFKAAHLRSTFSQSFTLTAYCYGAILLFRAVDGLIWVQTWLCWAFGVFFALKAFYMGLGRIVKPDPSKALGLYFLSCLIFTAGTGLAHFLSRQFIEGRWTL